MWEEVEGVGRSGRELGIEEMGRSGIYLLRSRKE